MTHHQQQEVDRLANKKQMIQNQINEAKLQRSAHKRQNIMNQINYEKEEEIQRAFDEFEISEHISNTKFENHIRSIRDNQDMYAWLNSLKTKEEVQLWYDYVTDYNNPMLMNIEFNSDLGWNDQEMDQYSQERDEEIDEIYDEIDRIDTNELLSLCEMKKVILDTDENLPAYTWMEQNKTIKEQQFWFCFMLNYDEDLLVDLEFASDKGWYTECSDCQWSINPGFDEDHCHCGKIINF